MPSLYMLKSTPPPVLAMLTNMSNMIRAWQVAASWCVFWQENKTSVIWPRVGLRRTSLLQRNKQRNCKMVTKGEVKGVRNIPSQIAKYLDFSEINNEKNPGSKSMYHLGGRFLLLSSSSPSLDIIIIIIIIIITTSTKRYLAASNSRREESQIKAPSLPSLISCTRYNRKYFRKFQIQQQREYL